MNSRQPSNKSGEPTESESVVCGILALLRASARPQSQDAGGSAVADVGFEGSGVSLHQFKALLSLTYAEEGTLSLKAVGMETGLSAPAVSRIIDSLVESGLVVRSEDPVDRRIRLATLTPAGRKLAERFTERRIAAVRAFVDSLDDRQRDLLAQSFAALSEHPHFAFALEAAERSDQR